MSFLDKVGKLAMDGLEKAMNVADKVQERVGVAKPEDKGDIPDPFANDSPFIAPEPEEDDKPLGNPEIPAQVFGPGTDPWTGRTLQLLTDHDTEHEFVDLESEGGLKIETRLVSETGQDSAPYVFIRGELVGGYNALNEIVRLGQLDEMTKHPDERSGDAPGGIRIVIAKREGDDKPPGETS